MIGMIYLKYLIIIVKDYELDGIFFLIVVEKSEIILCRFIKNI